MVTITSKTDERRNREEIRRKHLHATRDAAARADAELRIAPAKAPAGVLSPALEQFAAFLGRRFGEQSADIAQALDELRSEIRKELAADLTEHRGTRDRAARHAAEGAAQRAAAQIRDELRADLVRLERELEMARREIEALKAERQQLRAIR